MVEVLKDNWISQASGLLYLKLDLFDDFRSCFAVAVEFIRLSVLGHVAKKLPGPSIEKLGDTEEELVGVEIYQLTEVIFCRQPDADIVDVCPPLILV